MNPETACWIALAPGHIVEGAHQGSLLINQLASLEPFMQYANFIAFFQGAGAFAGFGLARLGEYQWPINEAFRQRFPDLPGGNGHGANIQLRQRLHQQWQSADAAKRAELAHLVIAVWGGVNGNRPKTIERYAALAADANPLGNFALAGIASQSKVLCIANPVEFAIYDARVSVALAAINLLAQNNRGLYFPYVPSRRRDVSEFQRKYSQTNLRQTCPKAAFLQGKQAYGAYCETLRDLAPQLRSTVQDLEMCLFTQSIDLINSTRDLIE